MSAENEIPFSRADLLRLAAVALAALICWLRVVPPFRGVDLVAIAGALAGGTPLVRESLSALRRLRMTMELSMSLAVIAAFVAGEPVTALVILAFVLAAEMLEELTVARGERALHDLSAHLPQRAVVERDGVAVEIAADEVSAGELVHVRPGSRIPVDGEVLEGLSFVAEAEITGEPTPAAKHAGSTVFAGTLNGSGALRVRASASGRDTAFGRIVAAIEKAAASRAPIERIADRLAGGLVAFALLGAAATWLWSHDLRAATAALIVAGACGVAAGTPLAIVGALGRASRAGLVVKGGEHVESLARVDLIVFDKTGTLTQGRPAVIGVHPAAGADEAALLSVACALEALSEHPLARAIVAHGARLGVAPISCESATAHPGSGVSGNVGAEVARIGSRAFLEASGVELPPGAGERDLQVSWGSRYLGAIQVADPIRPEARPAVAELQMLGLRVEVLTGDSAAAAGEIARAVGADAGEGRLLPADKQRRVAELRRSGRRVAMVGDGINDAPALLEADVGIAVGSGADVTLDSADLVLVGSDLRLVAEGVRIARACRAIILQNFAATIVVDALGMAAAAAGWLAPASAAAVHVVSELACLVNAARMLPGRKRPVLVPIVPKQTTA